MNGNAWANPAVLAYDGSNDCAHTMEISPKDVPEREKQPCRIAAICVSRLERNEDRHDRFGGHTLRQDRRLGRRARNLDRCPGPARPPTLCRGAGSSLRAAREFFP